MKVKLVIWDLDKTLWNGVLAEKEELEINQSRIKLIKQLNEKGIVNSICSKNDFNETKEYMQKQNIWDYFVFPKIEFLPKGEQVKSILREMHLRAENTVFIDDNNSNLEEVKYFNPKITTINEKDCDDFLNDVIKNAKDDKELKRLKQYRQLECKTKVQQTFSSNEEFLRQSNIKIKFLDVNEELFDRLYELSERTNQLNFTKNRMTEDELKAMLEDSSITTRLIQASDNFGDYGIIGFYTISDNNLIHFVFSCRIMNMGIEQFVYQYLKFPHIEIAGDVASKLNQNSNIDYIRIIDKNSDSNDEESISNVLDEESKIKIFAIGACDLYHPIAYFSMPNQEFLYECNVFIGNERGVNVGTEYIRSQLEMNKEEKEYIKNHFSNYTRYNVFDSKIFGPEWDYIIMSFHDDMIFKIYEKKNNPNLRIIFSPAPQFGSTSVLNIHDKVRAPLEEQQEWLKENFNEGYYISEERFLSNLLWIGEHVSKKSKIILITGPEQEFFRESIPTCPAAKEQIKKINNVIKKVGKKYKDKFIVADINKVVKTKNDYTNYIFHLTAQSAYNLFLNIIDLIVKKTKCNKPKMLENIAKGRKILIWGKNYTEIQNAYYNLKMGNVTPCSIVNEKVKPDIKKKFIKDKFKFKYDLRTGLSDWKKYKNKNKKYYVVVADKENYNSIRQILIKDGYSPLKDFALLKPIEYTKIWRD